jgi:hypothetical protein
MAIGDIPHIASSNYTNTAYALNAGGLGYVDNSSTTAGQWLSVPVGTSAWTDDSQEIKRYVAAQTSIQAKPVVADMADKTTSRFVRVIIVDPNENLSLEDRLVYKGEEKFTDLNDQELFFELEIKAMLAAHNEKRVKTVNKTVKERTEYLDAAKIRDLRMVVVNIATF